MSDRVPGGLPEYRSSLRIRPVGPPGMVDVGDGGASGLMALSRSLGQVGGMFEGLADQDQADRGAEAGRNVPIERDEQGMPIPPQMRRDTTPFGRSFDTAARQAYLDTAKQDAATELTRLAMEHRNTPEAFLVQARTRIEAMTAAMPAEFRNELGREFGSIAEGMGRNLLTGWATQQNAQARDAWSRENARYGEEWRLLMLGGAAADSPEVLAARDRLTAHLTRGVLAGHISPDQRALLIEEAAANGMVSSIAGEAGRIAQREGPEAATAWANAMLARPEIAAAGDRVVSWARAEVQRQVYEARIGRDVLRGEAREAVQALGQSLSAGVQVSPDRAEEVARQATRAGLPRLAEEARAIGAIGGEVSALAGAGLREMMQAYQRAITGDPTDPRNPMRARFIGDMIRQQVRQLQQDPVGWAQTQPAVRAATDRLARGEGTMSDVIRAQDAVMAEQGVSVVNARVLSVARARQIAETVKQAPPSQQAAELERVFQGYGPEHRWRVWNDLRRADVPAGLRPAMILMTSEQTRSALPQFLRASEMTDAQRTDVLGGADEMRRLNDRIETRMEQLRAAVGSEDAAYLADVTHAVRMVAIGGTGSARERVDAAYRQVVEGHTRIERVDGSDIRIPVGTRVDLPRFERLIRGAMWRGDADTRTAEEIEADPNRRLPSMLVVPPGAVPARPGLTDEARQEQYWRAVQARGRWVTLPDGTGVVLRDGENRPVSLRNGQYMIVRYGEEATGEIGSLRAPPPPVAPAAPGPQGNASDPRGIRNNNPLNIEGGRFSQSQPGYVGSDGRFARFETMEQGIAAADSLLQRYAEMGLNTPAQIIGRWAPGSDGNDVPAYANRVARALGIGPNDRLDMNDAGVRRRLIEAMAEVENGRPLPPMAPRR